MTLEDRIGEDFSDYIMEEYCLTHSLDKYTVEAMVYVRFEEPNGKIWEGKRIIKMRLRRQN